MPDSRASSSRVSSRSSSSRSSWSGGACSSVRLVLVSAAVLVFAVLAASLLEHVRWRAHEANWAGNVRFRWADGVGVGGRVSTASIAFVQSVVREAADAGRRLHVVGAGHSWNHIANPDGAVLLSIHAMRRVLDVKFVATAADSSSSSSSSSSSGGGGGGGADDVIVEQPSRVSPRRDRVALVHVEAGITLHALYDELDARGLALEIGPSVDEQTLAGALATATHGSSVWQPSLSALVRAYDIVLANGTLVTLSGRRAALASAHLGALGVVVGVRIRAVDRFTIAYRTEFVPTSTVAAGSYMLDVARANAYAKFWVLTHSGYTKVFTGNATAYERALETGLPSRVSLEADVYLFEAASRLDSVLPGLQHTTAPLAIAAARVLKPVEEYRVRPDHYFTIPHHVPLHPETEYSVPAALCGALVAEIVATVEARQLSINQLIEVRFVRAEPAGVGLSPDYDGDRCHISLLFMPGWRNAEHFWAYFSEFEGTALRMGGRPHWAKHFSSATRDLLPGMYGAQWVAFWSLADELDPRGMFRNVWLDEIRGRPRVARLDG